MLNYGLRFKCVKNRSESGYTGFLFKYVEKSVIYKAEISHMTKLWIFSQTGDDRAEAFL